MIGKFLKKAIVVVLSAVIISLMCPLNVLAGGDITQSSSSVSLEKDYSGTLSDSNVSDWYKFTIPGAGRVTIDTKADDSIVFFSLFYGPNAENQIYYSNPVWNEYTQVYNMGFTYDLTGGTYYFLATNEGHGVVDYEFNVHFSDFAESNSETYDKNNDSFGTASRIYLNTSYSSCVVYNDELDYFKFVVPVDTTISINAYAYVNSLNYYLYDSNYNSLAYQSSPTSGSVSNVIKRDLKKGTYYFVVRGSGNYYGKCIFAIMANNLPDLSITEQPSDIQAGIGEYVGFFVTAKGTDLNYQWQTRTNGVWVNSSFPGADTDTIEFQMTEALDGTQYRCLITDSYQQSITSNIVYLDLDPIYITSQPENYSGTVGSTAKYTIKAKAKGVGIKYQWQMYSSGKWVDSTFTGAKSATLSVPVTSDINGAKFRCILTASDYSFSTSSIEAYMKVTNPLSIITQPSNYSGPVGSKAAFSVVAQGTGLTYQWQYYTGSAWKNFGSNKPTASLTVSNSHNGMKYRCIVKDIYGNSETSNVATIKITTQTLSITTQPKDYTGPIGSKASFSIVAQGVGLSYQWQYYSGGKWNDFGSNKPTASLTVSNLHNGMKYRCIVKDSLGHSVTSNIATIHITNPTLSITTQPKNYTGSIGSRATFSVVAQGVGLTYQWQYYSGGKWNDFGSNKPTTSLTISKSHNGMKYRCIVKDSFGKSVTSNVVTIKIV